MMEISFLPRIQSSHQGTHHHRHRVVPRQYGAHVSQLGVRSFNFTRVAGGGGGCLDECQLEMLLASTPSPLSSAPQSEEGKLTAAEWDNLHQPAPAAVERTHPSASDFNYRLACDSIDLDCSIPAVPQSSLRVGPSRYGFFLAGALSFTVGDALTATVDILPGQRIAQFVGLEISTEAAADLPDGSNNYLITVSDEIVLNCEDTARARPVPRCFASNANMAEGLHSAGVTLTIHGNNASADLSSDAEGRPIAWLYAVTFIAAGDEIMWSYGVEYAGGFDVADDSDSDYEPPRERGGGGGKHGAFPSR